MKYPYCYERILLGETLPRLLTFSGRSVWWMRGELLLHVTSELLHERITGYKWLTATSVWLHFALWKLACSARFPALTKGCVELKASGISVADLKFKTAGEELTFSSFIRLMLSSSEKTSASTSATPRMPFLGKSDNWENIFLKDPLEKCSFQSSR